jgi:CheY-like chemotaxis protein
LAGPNHALAVSGASPAFDQSKTALSQLQEEEFDCVVLDLKLPDMTGFELIEKLQTNGRPDMPIYLKFYQKSA